MANNRLVREAFDAATVFLKPKNRGSSVLEILSKDILLSFSDDTLARTVIIEKALEILTRIHTAFAAPVEDNGQPETDHGPEDMALEDAKRRRLLHALLDLISLEGIYPSLSPGVGIPLQERVISVLPAGVIAKPSATIFGSNPEDESLLNHILTGILNILFDARPSIQPVIRGRILSDIVSGTADLAFNSKTLPVSEKNNYREAFRRVVNETSSPVLLSMLASFLKSDIAPWLKPIISSEISLVPLRQDGVLQTILFIASQFAPSLGQEAQNQITNGPHFTVQAIMHTSKLLSSVPRDMDPSAYFQKIAPQLLALLDSDDPDLRRTTAYVIGNGILGKRAYGAPRTIGHSLFVKPIFQALTAEINQTPSCDVTIPTDGEHPHGAGGNLQEPILVDESTIRLMIERLSVLTLQHPNPGLVKRLIYPILLPLWGLACFALEQQLSTMKQQVITMLQTFFSVSSGGEPLQKLANNLLWDGGATWTYCQGTNGGVSLKNRHTTSRKRFNIVQLLDSLDHRAELFVKLLGSDPKSEEHTGDIFLLVSRSWLMQPSTSQRPSNWPRIAVDGDESKSVIQKLVNAKLAEKLLDSFKDILSRRPLRILELVNQLIDGELRRRETRQRRELEGGGGKVSLSSLANIVEKNDDKQAESSADEESAELLSAVFSLLSTILASPEFHPSQEIRPVLDSVKSSLDKLLPLLPPSLSKPGTTASMLLEIQLSSPEQQSQPESKQKQTHVSDLDTHRQALTNLNSDLPPVQAEGLSLISDLIKESSPVLDIPSTLALLLSILTESVSESTSNEEFIYLNVIKLIGTLASRHPRTVVKVLVERYADRNEERTLDQRLRIGESLLRTVQDLGEALTGETAKVLGEGIISVAGRRGRKPQTQRRQREQLEKETRKREQELRKQQEFPMATDLEEVARGYLKDEDSEAETPEQAAFSARTLSVWAAGAASDEDADDLRVRASAISILASAIQTNLAGLGPSIASSAVDLALNTLTLESDPESAILRRASVILLLDILKSLDTARETRGAAALNFGFSLSDDTGSASILNETKSYGGGPSTIGNLPHMLRTLKFVESCETDSTVRGHIRVLIESLEAWMEKSLLWGIGLQGEQRELEERLELGDRIAGLSVNPLAGRSGSGRPRIEEIE
ncbi:hypothetical protein MPDQ_002856 [Monascus purpureus]|uniref:RNA polymerase II assembly factor Rtp1 C-terminal domain-containing protein n=1 Tax=Monascus purpureus TaxID=5098 RepID=A0A507QJV7_MONPU|nr:hypothetical protein MPDQ_002856 [Monascus purpureus]